MEERLHWVFSLYDINKHGFIGQTELHLVTQAIYDLLSKQIHSPVSRTYITAHARKIFIKLAGSVNRKTITRCEFVEACLQDEILCNSFLQFDTKL
jgi:Ca2+-binding EF-hand superfamily protein